MKFIAAVILLVVGMYGITGCGSYLNYDSDFTMIVRAKPTKHPKTSINPNFTDYDVDTIAVLPFADSEKPQSQFLDSPPYPPNVPKVRYPYNDDGQFIADLVSTALQTSYVYKVVDRKYLDKVLEEQSLQSSALIDETEAIKIGELSGADAIITGDVYRCNYYKQWAHEDSRYIFQDLAEVEVSFKLIDTETGDLLYTCNHIMFSRNLLDEPIEMENHLMLNDPDYYNDRIADLNVVAETLVSMAIKPLIDAKIEDER